MTIQLRFRLEFKSDWHVGAGHGLGVRADAAIQRDPDGIPIISGATLKGLFRDALHDLRTHSGYGKDFPGMILGSAEIESVWQFSEARPVDDEQLPRLEPGDDHAHIVTGVRVQPATRSAERGKLYQREMGSRALVFGFTIEGSWPTQELTDQEAVEWLVVAARYIRRLGSRRRRGAGKCRIALDDLGLQAELLTAFERRRREARPAKLELPRRSEVFNPQADRDETARRYRLFLRADNPLVVAQRPESGNVYETRVRIPGQTLRGALAKRVNPARLDDAGLETFLRLFVLGGVWFNDLLLWEPDDTGQAGHVVDMLPLGIVKCADGILGNTLILPSLKNLRDCRNYQAYAGLQDGWTATLRPNAFQRTTRMHVQVDPESKRADDGNLFAYDAIPRGSYFVGEITLQEDVMWPELSALLRANLEQPFELAVGKGRRRGYGACTAWIEPLPDDDPPLWTQMPLAARLGLLPPRQLVVTLVSDTILLDHWGRAIQRFEASWLADELRLNKDEFQIADSVVRSRLVEGFDTLSGLPRWRDRALMAGSGVRFEVGFDPLGRLEHFADLERRGIGLRRNEGFGRIVFNHPWHTMSLQAEFAAPIRLPETLAQSRPATGNTRAEFLVEWRDLLDEDLERQLFLDEKGRFITLYRTLARCLIERRPADPDEAEQYLQALGEPPEAGQEPYRLSTSYLNNRSKENRFNPKVVEHVVTLLRRLNRTYPDHWQRGLVMLAEEILNLSQPEEKDIAHDR